MTDSTLVVLLLDGGTRLVGGVPGRRLNSILNPSLCLGFV